MKQKILLIQSMGVLLFLFSCGKEEILEDKVEIRVVKGRISDAISVNGTDGNAESEESKIKSLDPEIGQYTFAISAKDNLGSSKDRTGRLSGQIIGDINNPTPPTPVFLSARDYLPVIKLGKDNAWFSNTGSVSRNNILMAKTALRIVPIRDEIPKVLVYCSFVYDGNFYQFKNFPITFYPGTSTIFGFTQYTVEAYKLANLPLGIPQFSYTVPHYDGSGNFITGGSYCVANCGLQSGPNASAWEIGKVNVTSVGYVNGPDEFTIQGTLTVRGTTAPFNLIGYYRVH